MFILDLVSSWGMGQDLPPPGSTGPRWHVPALLSAAGLHVSPAPQLCPSPSSLLLPNPPLCHHWPFCELDQASPAPPAQLDGLWAAFPCQHWHGMSPPSPPGLPPSSLAVTSGVQARELPQGGGHGGGCVFPLLLTQPPLQTPLTDQNFIC